MLTDSNSISRYIWSLSVNGSLDETKTETDKQALKDTNDVYG